MIMMVGIIAVVVGGNRTPFYNCRALWVVFSNDHLVTLSSFVAIHYVGYVAFVRSVASTVVSHLSSGQHSWFLGTCEGNIACNVVGLSR